MESRLALAVRKERTAHVGASQEYTGCNGVCVNDTETPCCAVDLSTYVTCAAGDVCAQDPATDSGLCCAVSALPTGTDHYQLGSPAGPSVLSERLSSRLRHAVHVTQTARRMFIKTQPEGPC